jgi:hypothetical protein
MSRALLLAAAFALPVVALAQPVGPSGQPPALHDKAYYATHKAVRDTTLRWCHSDSTHADFYDCQNAEAADAGTIGKPRTLDQYLSDPNYWVQNPIARGGALIQCNRRAPGDEMVLPYCAAVRAGAALAKGHRP